MAFTMRSTTSNYTIGATIPLCSCHCQLGWQLMHMASTDMQAWAIAIAMIGKVFCFIIVSYSINEHPSCCLVMQLKQNDAKCYSFSSCVNVHYWFSSLKLADYCQRVFLIHSGCIGSWKTVHLASDRNSITPILHLPFPIPVYMASCHCMCSIHCLL